MSVEDFFDEWWVSKELLEKGFNKTAMLDFAESYHKHVVNNVTFKNKKNE